MPSRTRCSLGFERDGLAGMAEAAGPLRLQRWGEAWRAHSIFAIALRED